MAHTGPQVHCQNRAYREHTGPLTNTEYGQVHTQNMAYREHTGPLTVNTEYGLTVHNRTCIWLTVNRLGH